MGSGKSTVAEMFAELGAVVIDADLLAREVVAPGTPGFEAVVARFGADVISGDGTLNRPALGQIVFSDAGARSDLNSIIHPLVRQRSSELASRADPSATVVMMIPLLVETGQDADFDALVVVDVPEEVQRARVRARDSLTDEQINARLQAQASREERLNAATHVITNAGSRAETRRQVERIWRELQDPAYSSSNSRNHASS